MDPLSQIVLLGATSDVKLTSFKRSFDYATLHFASFTTANINLRALIAASAPQKVILVSRKELLHLYKSCTCYILKFDLNSYATCHLDILISTLFILFGYLVLSHSNILNYVKFIIGVRITNVARC